jgi:uncharacterized RDD family membrane protein YckC
MFCSRCGLRLEEGIRFCQNCGQEVGVLAPGAAATVYAASAPVGVSAGVSSPQSYAGFWVRFVAYFIDGLILGIPTMFVLLILVFLFGGFGVMMRRNLNDPRAAAAVAGPMILGFVFVWLVFIALSWLYFAGMESSERQATFGKATMSLHVTSLEGQRLSFGHATGRYFAKIISGLIPLGIGYIMAGFTEKKQALHDMIAGTLVLRK